MDAYGLLPADNFRVTTGHRADRSLLPQAAWYFRDETIAVPKPGLALAGFAPDLTLVRDLAAWTASNPPGAAPGYPPLVWLGSPQFIRDVALDPGGAKISTTHGELALQLAERLALNGAWFDAASIAFFCGRPVKIRGIYRAETFVARTFWPQDFRLPALPASGILAAGPAAIRDRVRAQPQGGARSPFAVESLWRRPGAPAVQAGQPLVGLMLNGAQGDDDEAHGGHFALMTGQVGSEGALDDLLVNNFYSLDSESEKGILAAPVPLDNYLGDLNSGQAWYRPSYMLVATLREARVAHDLQSALGRVYNHFYRHQFAYQHASANCAGISVVALRSIGWRVPVRGPESWLKAIPALPLIALRRRSLRQGKAVFDYLTEDRTRLYPAAAFEEMTADLLALARGQGRRPASDFERLLAADVQEIMLVRVPQFPSSRAWGDWPVESSVEYAARVPADPAQRKIIPVPPRPFPAELRDPCMPGEPPLRSDYAVLAWALAIVALFVFTLRWLLA